VLDDLVDGSVSPDATTASIESAKDANIASAQANSLRGILNQIGLDNASLRGIPPKQKFTQITSALERAGVPGVGAIMDAPFRDRIMAEADTETVRFLRDNDFLNLQGRGVEAAKLTVRDSLMAIRAAASVPLFGHQRLDMQVDHLNTLVQQRIAQMFEQARSAGDEAALEETREIAALSAQLQHARPDEIDELYKAAAFASRHPPRNQQEAQGRVPLAQQFGRPIGFDNRVKSRGLSLSSDQSLRTVVDYAAVMHRLFGRNEWGPALINSFDRQRLQRTFAELGVTGVEDILPQSALNVLVQQKAAQKGMKEEFAELEPAQKEELLEFEARFGEDAAEEQYRNILQTVVAQSADASFLETVIGPSPALGPTPAERTAGQVIGQAFFDAFVRWPVDAGRELSSDLQKNYPGVFRGLIGGISALSSSEEEREIIKSADSIAEAMNLVFLLSETTGGGTEVISDNPVFNGATNKQRAAVVRAQFSAREAFEKGYPNFRKAMARNARGWAEDGSFVDWLQLQTQSLALNGFIKPFHDFVDDPSTAPAFLLQEIAGAYAIGGVFKGVGAGTRVVLRGQRLRNGLHQIARFAPEEAVQFKGAINRAMAETDNVVRRQKLEAADAAVERLAESYKKGGGVDAQDKFVRGVGDVWADIQFLEELGPLSKITDPNVVGAFSTLNQSFRRVMFGGADRPPRTFNSLLSSLSGEKADNALKKLLQGGADQHEILRRQEEFIRNNGRLPTNTELAAAVMPEAVADLKSLLLNGAHIPLRDPLVSRAVNRVRRLFGGARELQGLDSGRTLAEIREAAEQQFADIMEAGGGTMQATLEWGLRRQRTEGLLDIARRKIRQRLDADSFTERLQTLARDSGRRETGFDLELPGNIAAARQQLQLVDNALDRLGRHEATEVWDVPAESDIWGIVQAEITADDLELLLRNNPTAFGGVVPEAILETVVTKPTKDAVKQAADNFKRARDELTVTRRQLDNIRAKPLDHDTHMRAWDQELKALRAKRKATPADAIEDPSIDVEISRIRQLMARRADALKKGEIDPDQLATAQHNFNLGSQLPNTTSTWLALLTNAHWRPSAVWPSRLFGESCQLRGQKCSGPCCATRVCLTLRAWPGQLGYSVKSRRRSATHLPPSSYPCTCRARPSETPRSHSAGASMVR
jgi:hypothetical protein